MKKLISILILFVMTFSSVSCQVNKEESNSVNAIAKEEMFSIYFDFSNIISIDCLEDDDKFVIRYNDPDVFDYENLAYLTGREKWYGKYVVIDIDDELLKDFLYNYIIFKNSKEYYRKDALNETYSIIEHDIVYEDGTKDIIFTLGFNDVK